MENILKSLVFEPVFYIAVMPILMDFVLWKTKKIRYRKHLQILSFSRTLCQAEAILQRI